MSLFVLSDLHLSTAKATDKSMEVFGPAWANYTDRIRNAWTKIVSDTDTIVVGGDISWALTLGEAESDLAFLHSLPGKKILLKGNHDFWWTTLQKMRTFASSHGFDDLTFLQNNAFFCENFILCGSRGWFYENDVAAKNTGADYERMILREASRLQLSLSAGHVLQQESEEKKELLAFLHFPPIWNGLVCQPIIDTLVSFSVKRCFFGHIHGANKTSFVESGISFTLTAADALSFTPKIIFPSSL